MIGKYYGEKEFCLEGSSYDPILRAILVWTKTLSEVLNGEVLIKSMAESGTILCSKQPYRKISTFVTDLPCPTRVENMEQEDSLVY